MQSYQEPINDRDIRDEQRKSRARLVKISALFLVPLTAVWVGHVTVKAWNNAINSAFNRALLVDVWRK